MMATYGIEQVVFGTDIPVIEPRPGHARAGASLAIPVVRAVKRAPIRPGSST